MRYRAWGETRHTLTNAPTDRRFTGQAEETGIELYFYGARWYCSYLNRWTSPDTDLPERQGRTRGFDRYAFVANKLVEHIDPGGSLQAAKTSPPVRQPANLANPIFRLGFCQDAIQQSD